METTSDLYRPITFHIGDQYLFMESPFHLTSLIQPTRQRLVNFEAYDVCPALVIVRNGNGKRWRCPRDQLFINRYTT